MVCWTTCCGVQPRTCTSSLSHPDPKSSLDQVLARVEAKKICSDRDIAAVGATL
ncbi:hypothetical protein PAXRUDRAFT_824763 [Paxillus rubicundulus Ve08.2h10]|uniref:Uncharacterized protein n=1 Tax=Paxillus rubicundulus Ve08.2h10 TaxID=930991 RepID=A0A0D0E7C7_9AGAM|nr:hypothetical protein PAXRUDRAFT_824763 [Paxillus rubicundulus Ve08.2h10]